MDPLHEILAIALGLPVDYLKNIHKYDVKSEVCHMSRFVYAQSILTCAKDHLRYMKYTKFSPEENDKLGGLWGRGHTGTQLPLRIRYGV